MSIAMRVESPRVLVMDGANNSVKTLRAFASQHKYHYIVQRQLFFPFGDNYFSRYLYL